MIMKKICFFLLLLHCFIDHHHHYVDADCEMGQMPRLEFLGTNRQENVTVTFSCKDGFTLEGEPRAKCLPNGQWYFHGRCVETSAVTCPTEESENLIFVDPDKNKPGDRSRFICKQGFNVVGSSNTAICNDAGQWDFLGACQPGALTNNNNFNRPSVRTKCPIRPRKSLQFVTTTNNQASNMIPFICKPGYKLNGQAYALCQQNFRWKFLGKCIAHREISPPTTRKPKGKPCPLPLPAGYEPNGNGDNQHESSYFFTCSEGFTLHQRNEVICSDGEWNFEGRCEYNGATVVTASSDLLGKTWYLSITEWVAIGLGSLALVTIVFIILFDFLQLYHV